MGETTRGQNVEGAPIHQLTDATAEQKGGADLIVGILAESDSDAIAKMCDALRTLPGPLRIAVLYDDPQQGSAPVSPQATQERAFVFYAPSLLAKQEVPATGVFRMSE